MYYKLRQCNISMYQFYIFYLYVESNLNISEYFHFLLIIINYNKARIIIINSTTFPDKYTDVFLFDLSFKAISTYPCRNCREISKFIFRSDYS